LPKRICRMCSIASGKRVRRSVSVRDWDCRSRKGSSRRMEAAFGSRANSAAAALSASRFRIAYVGTARMLRDALREQTRAQHARLEQRLAIEQRVRDRDAYVELLGRFHGFYKPFETRLLTFARAFHEHGVMLSERMKTALLERDLHALGESEFELADSTFLPSIATFPRAVGSLYVMEGSTLG